MTSDRNSEIAGVRTWYNLTAAQFAERYSGQGGEFWLRFEETLALELLPARSNRILDLGCGPGRLAPALSQRAATVAGADIAHAMILQARARTVATNVYYSVVDATQAAFRSSSFDSVISLGMFEYLDDPSPFLAEIFRVLAPGGVAIFTCYNHPPAPLRAWAGLRSAIKRTILRLSARTASATYESRGSLYSVVRQDAKKMTELLAASGFERIDRRGFHYRFTTRLFRLAGVSRVASPAKSFAVATDRLLGKAHLTRNLAPLAMYIARKPG